MLRRVESDLCRPEDCHPSALLRVPLWAPLRDPLWAPLWAPLRDPLWAPLWAPLRDPLWAPLWAPLRDPLWAPLWDPIRFLLGASCLGFRFWFRARVYWEVHG